MSHEHDIVCGACGNELRSKEQQRCAHCGAGDPRNATEHPADSVGDPEVPQRVAGMTREQMRRFLESPEPDAVEDYGFNENDLV